MIDHLIESGPFLFGLLVLILDSPVNRHFFKSHEFPPLPVSLVQTIATVDPHEYTRSGTWTDHSAPIFCDGLMNCYFIWFCNRLPVGKVY